NDSPEMGAAGREGRARKDRAASAIRYGLVARFGRCDRRAQVAWLIAYGWGAEAGCPGHGGNRVATHKMTADGIWSGLCWHSFGRSPVSRLQSTSPLPPALAGGTGQCQHDSSRLQSA